MYLISFSGLWFWFHKWPKQFLWSTYLLNSVCIFIIDGEALLSVYNDEYVYLVYVFHKNIVKSVQHFIIVILVEAGEHHLDVFIKKEVNGWAPELSLQSGVDGHHHIRLLNLFGLDKSRGDWLCFLKLKPFTFPILGK